MPGLWEWFAPFLKDSSQLVGMFSKNSFIYYQAEWVGKIALIWTALL
jgi:hypothetical protein